MSPGCAESWTAGRAAMPGCAVAGCAVAGAAVPGAAWPAGAGIVTAGPSLTAVPEAAATPADAGSRIRLGSLAAAVRRSHGAEGSRKCGMTGLPICPWGLRAQTRHRWPNQVAALRPAHMVNVRGRAGKQDSERISRRTQLSPLSHGGSSLRDPGVRLNRTTRPRCVPGRPVRSALRGLRGFVRIARTAAGTFAWHDPHLLRSRPAWRSGLGASPNAAPRLAERTQLRQRWYPAGPGAAGQAQALPSRTAATTSNTTETTR